MAADEKTGRQLTFLAVTALVMLRFAIGWHFFVDGSKKLNDPSFRSAYFLDGAVGPLSGFFHRLIPDPFGLQRIDIDGLRTDWKTTVDRVVDRAGEESEVADAAKRILVEYQQRLNTYESQHGAELGLHRLEVERYESAQRDPNVAQVEFGAKWLREKRTELRATARSWIQDLNQMDAAFRKELVKATASDAAQLTSGGRRDEKAWVDHGVSWTVFGVGVLLMLGLLVPMAAIIGAGFLISVLLTQPFWVAEANLSYLPYQLVELAGLLVLAASRAGRFAGLDFFVSMLRRRKSR